MCNRKSHADSTPPSELTRYEEPHSILCLWVYDCQTVCGYTTVARNSPRPTLIIAFIYTVRNIGLILVFSLFSIYCKQSQFIYFLLRNDVLVRYMLWPCVYLSVSVCHKHSMWAERKREQSGPKVEWAGTERWARVRKNDDTASVTQVGLPAMKIHRRTDFLAKKHSWAQKRSSEFLETAVCVHTSSQVRTYTRLHAR